MTTEPQTTAEHYRYGLRGSTNVIPVSCDTIEWVRMWIAYRSKKGVGTPIMCGRGYMRVDDLNLAILKREQLPEETLEGTIRRLVAESVINA